MSSDFDAMPAVPASALEQWASKLDLRSAMASLESADMKAGGRLRDLQIGNENFGDAIARRTGQSARKVNDIISKVDNFFISNRFLSPSFSGESLVRGAGNEAPHTYIQRKELGTDFSANTVAELAVECLGGSVPESAVASTVRELGAIMSTKDMRGAAFENSRDSRKDAIDLHSATGSRAYGHYAAAQTGLESLRASLESFGASINQLNVNTRLAVLVTILRNFTSTIDKLFVRVTDESNTVIFTIPNPTVFSLDKMNYTKSDVRNNPENEVALVNLHAEPSMVNTDPQPVMPNINAANDTTGALDTKSLPGQIALSANGAFANLSDLTANSNRLGFENANHTDSIAEGGSVKTVVIAATQGSTTEYFAVSVAGLPNTKYITLANNSDSSETIVNLLEQPFYLTVNSLTAAGSKTALFASLNKAAVRLSVNFQSSLRLKYCDIQGSGSATAAVVPTAGVSAESASSDIQSAGALLKDVTFKVVSFVPELFFNEENLRKTTVSTRVNWLQRSFQIPQGKNFTVDSALDQGREEGAIEAVQTAMSIGNSDRGMSVLESRLEETADIIATAAAANPEVYRSNRIQNLSFAATLCRPYVLRAEADYETLNVAVMRESERLTDRHAKMTQMLLNGLANVISRSLYSTSVNAGERITFKALMHSVTADVLFGIPSYHATLEDAVPKANGADYSFVLDNGIRIDVVKTNFHNWQGKVAVVPVREDDPASILSFASIRDRGVFAGTVPGADYNGSTVIRDVVNSREFVMVTNPIGMIIDVKNIDNDLGPVDIIDAV